MSNGWVPFGAALAGALVGGAASSVGSVVVARYHTRREARLYLFQDELPVLIALLERSFGPSDIPAEEILGRLKAVYRRAILTSRREEHLAWAALDHWAKLVSTIAQFVPGRDIAVDAYNDWVAWKEPAATAIGSQHGAALASIAELYMTVGRRVSRRRPWGG